MARLTAPNRFAVRLALVTGTTVATIVGAQTLATLDAKAFSQGDISTEVDTTNFVAEPLTQDVDTFINTLSVTEASNTAPDIVIIRHTGSNSAVVPGASTTNTTVQTNTAVQAPSPAIVPPAPAQSVVVRRGPVTRSSR